MKERSFTKKLFSKSWMFILLLGLGIVTLSMTYPNNKDTNLNEKTENASNNDLLLSSALEESLMSSFMDIAIDPAGGPYVVCSNAGTAPPYSITLNIINLPTTTPPQPDFGIEVDFPVQTVPPAAPSTGLMLNVTTTFTDTGGDGMEMVTFILPVPPAGLEYTNGQIQIQGLGIAPATSGLGDISSAMENISFGTNGVDCTCNDPNGVASATAETVCHNTVPTITLNDTDGGAATVTDYFEVTSTSTNATGATAGPTNIALAGTIETAMLTSTDGLTNGTVTYTVTPKSHGPDGAIGGGDDCSGTAFNVTVTVEPEPQATDPADETICSGDTPTTTIDVTALNGHNYVVSSVVAGANITGASTAPYTRGDGATLETNALTNIGSTNQTVVYTIQPYTDGPNATDDNATGDDCLGTTFTVTITVEAAPEATATDDTNASGTGAFDEVICSGSTPTGGFDLVNGTAGLVTSVQYGLVTGGAYGAGTGSVTPAAGTTLADGTAFEANMLVNSSTSAAIVTYTVCPYTNGPNGMDDMGAGDDCLATAGTDDNGPTNNGMGSCVKYDVLVQPTPEATATDDTNASGTGAFQEIICSGTVPTGEFDLVAGTNGLITAVNYGAVTGGARAVNGILGDDTAFETGMLVNATGADITVSYTVCPYTNGPNATDNSGMMDDCVASAGTDDNGATNNGMASCVLYEVIVQPAPEANATDDTAGSGTGAFDEVICSGNTPTGEFNIVNGTNGLVTAVNYGAVTGGARAVGNIFADDTDFETGTLVNATTADITVTYTVCPYTNGPNGTDDSGAGDDCLATAGTDDNDATNTNGMGSCVVYSVVVQPTPEATATDDTNASGTGAFQEIICSGTVPTGEFDLVAGTNGLITAVNYGAVTGGARAVNGILGDDTAFETGMLVNATGADITVSYTVCPYTNGPNATDNSGMMDDCVASAGTDDNGATNNGMASCVLYEVIVQPAPEATATDDTNTSGTGAFDEVICSGSTPTGAFDLVNGTAGLVTAVNYGAVTGGAFGAGTGAVTPTAGTTLADNVAFEANMLTNPTWSDITVTYTVCPYTNGPDGMDDMGGDDDCVATVGTDDNDATNTNGMASCVIYSVVVQPTPEAFLRIPLGAPSSNYLDNDGDIYTRTICSGDSSPDLIITLTGKSRVVSVNYGGVTGGEYGTGTGAVTEPAVGDANFYLTSPTNGSTSDANGVQYETGNLINSTTAPITVSYTICPYTFGPDGSDDSDPSATPGPNNQPGNDDCEATPGANDNQFTFGGITNGIGSCVVNTITVLPAPEADIVDGGVADEDGDGMDNTETVCSGEAPAATLDIVVGDKGIVTAVNYGTVTTSGTQVAVNDIIVDNAVIDANMLTNTGAADATVTYTICPFIAGPDGTDPMTTGTNDDCIATAGTDDNGPTNNGMGSCVTHTVTVVPAPDVTIGTILPLCTGFTTNQDYQIPFTITNTAALEDIQITMVAANGGGATAAGASDIQAAIDAGLTDALGSGTTNTTSPLTISIPPSAPTGTYDITIVFGNQRNAGALAVESATNPYCKDTETVTIEIRDCTPDISIADPCECLNDAEVNQDNGTFREVVVISDPLGGILPSNMTWTVTSITGAFLPNGSANVGPSGTPVVTVPHQLVAPVSYCSTPGGCQLDSDPDIDVPQGAYFIQFEHVDAAGYAIEVQGPNPTLGTATNQVLSISNTCFYPEVQILGPTVLCAGDAPVTYQANPVGTGTGTWGGDATFLSSIGGYIQSPQAGLNTTTGEFDPAAALAAGPGPYKISYVYNGDNSGFNDPGCVTVLEIEITVNDQISITGNVTDETCGDGTGEIEITATLPGGGTLTMPTYSWTGPGGFTSTEEDLTATSLAPATGLSMGSYTVVVTSDNGCSATATFHVGQDGSVGVTGIVTDETCTANDDGKIDLTLTGGAGSPSIMWSGPTTIANGTTMASGLESGAYSVTITDGGTCSTVAFFDVDQPEPLTLAVVSQTNVDCKVAPAAATGAVTLGAAGGTPGYTYSIATGSTTTVGTVSGNMITGMVAGDYTLQVEDDNGCMTTVDVTISEPSMALAASNSHEDPTCNGGSDGSIDLTVTANTGTAPYTFVWSNGAATEDISGLLAGTYTVTITDANGCILTQVETLNDPAALTLTATPTDADCAGNSLGDVELNVANGTGDYTYVLSTGETSGLTGDAPYTFSNTLSAGGYTATVTDSKGCTAVVSFEIDDPAALEANISAQQNVTCTENGSATVTVTGGVGATPDLSYDWSYDPPSGAANDVSNTTSLTSTATLPVGLHTVTIKDNNGTNCDIILSVDITDESVTPYQVFFDVPEQCDYRVIDLKEHLSVVDNSNATASPSGAFTLVSGPGSVSGDIYTPAGSGFAVIRYTIEDTDLDGVDCTVVEEETIEVRAPLGLSTVCAGCTSTDPSSPRTVNITNITGGLAPYTLSITGGTLNGTYDQMSSTASFTMNNNEVSYQVTLTDARGCVAYSAGQCQISTLEMTNVQNAICEDDPSYLIQEKRYLDPSIVPSGMVDFDDQLNVTDPQFVNTDFTAYLGPFFEVEPYNVAILPAVQPAPGDFEFEINIPSFTENCPLPGDDNLYVDVFVDLNNNGTFDVGENVGYFTMDATDFPVNFTLDNTGVLNIPAGIGITNRGPGIAAALAGYNSSTRVGLHLNYQARGGACLFPAQVDAPGATFGLDVTFNFSGNDPGQYTIEEQVTSLLGGLTTQPAPAGLITDNGDGTVTVNPSAATEGGTFILTYCVGSGINGSTGYPETGCVRCIEEIFTIHESNDPNFTLPGNPVCVSELAFALDNLTDDPTGSTWTVTMPSGNTISVAADTDASNNTVTTGQLELIIDDVTGDATLDPLAPGLYSITHFTGEASCQQSYTVTLEVAPDAVISGDINSVLQCATHHTGEEISFSFPPFSLVSFYSGGQLSLNGLLDGNATLGGSWTLLNSPPTATFGGLSGLVEGSTLHYTDPGCYEVEYTVSTFLGATGGCTATQIFNITVGESPAPAFDLPGQVCWSSGGPAITFDIPNNHLNSPNYTGNTNRNYETSAASVAIVSNLGLVTIIGAGTVDICMTESVSTNACGGNSFCQVQVCETIVVTETDASITASWTDFGPVCSDDATTDLTALVTGTAGGVFTGQGVSGTHPNYIFSPTGLAGQSVSICYTANTSGGCTATECHNIEVNDDVEITLASTNFAVCETGSNIDLTNYLNLAPAPCTDGFVFTLDIDQFGHQSGFYLYENGVQIYSLNPLSNIYAPQTIVLDFPAMGLTYNGTADYQVYLTDSFGGWNFPSPAVNNGEVGITITNRCTGAVVVPFTNADVNFGPGTVTGQVSELNVPIGVGAIPPPPCPAEILVEWDFYETRYNGSSFPGEGRLEIYNSAGVAVAVVGPFSDPNGTENGQFVADFSTTIGLDPNESYTIQDFDAFGDDAGSYRIVDVCSGTELVPWTPILNFGSGAAAPLTGITGDVVGGTSPAGVFYVDLDCNGVTPSDLISGSDIDISALNASCFVNGVYNLDICYAVGDEQTDLLSDEDACNQRECFVVTIYQEMNVFFDLPNMSCDGADPIDLAPHVSFVDGQGNNYTLATLPSWATASFNVIDGGGTINASNQYVGTSVDGFVTIEATVTSGTCMERVHEIIEIRPPVELSIDSTPVDCHGDADGTAIVTVTNGVAPYTYEWSSGATTANSNDATNTATGLAGGGYAVTVTDANGCSEVVAVTVTEPEPIIVVANNISDVTCNGDNDGSASGFISSSGLGTPPYIYRLIKGGVIVQTFPTTGTTTSTTYSFSGLTAGSYELQVLDHAPIDGITTHCFGYVEFDIDEPTLLIAEIISTTDETCPANDDGTATVNATGGTTGYTYEWSNGQTTATATGLAEGTTYSVTVTDANDCTAVTTATVDEPEELDASVNFQSDVSCNGGNDGEIYLTVTGGTGPFSYQWTGTPFAGGSQLPDDVQEHNDAPAGTYNVEITDANGCTTAINGITINEPTELTVTTSATNANCSGTANGSATATPSGGTADYTYLWSDGQTTAMASNLTAGGYAVTVTDANNCTVVAAVTIEDPLALEANISATTDVSCNGGNDGSATVNASGGAGGYDYLWSDPAGQTTATASGLTAGLYTVVVSDPLGTMCDVIVSVTIHEPTALALDLVSSTDETCDGGNDGEGTVNATGGTTPYTYAWGAGDTPTEAANSGLADGTYVVTVTDANDCTTTVSVTIGAGPALAIASIGNINVCPGGAVPTISLSSVPPNADVVFSWTAGGGLAAGSTPATGSQNPEIPAFVATSTEGTYTITVTANLGTCSTTTTFDIVVDDADDPVFINCPSNIVVGNDPSNCSAKVNWTIPAATDGCTGLPIVPTAGTSNAYEPGDDIPVGGPYTIEYIAMDGNGNSTTCSFTIMVMDTEDPIFTTTIPVDVTVECDAIPAAFVVNPMMHTSDNCTDAMNITVDYTESTIDSVCVNTKTIVRTWTITDEAGNTSSHVQKVYVQDTTAPDAVCIDYTLVLGTDGMGSITPDLINDGSTDNCTTDPANLTYALDRTDFDCNDVGTPVVVTLTVTDECGNASSCTATVTVVENPDIPCNPTYSFMGSDPCTCKNNATNLQNGQFDELIAITAPLGDTWTVVSVTGLFATSSAAPPATPTPLAVGTAMTFNAATNDYELEGIHVDEDGYTVTLQSANFGTTFTFSNTCFYPTPEFTNLPLEFCVGTNLTLDVEDAFGATGTTEFFIDGVPLAGGVFDASQFGIGSYELTATFDAGTAADFASIGINGATPTVIVDNDPNAEPIYVGSLAEAQANPGCMQTISTFINIVNTPSALGCNNQINLSLDATCTAIVTADMILEGTYGCFDNYTVTLTDPSGNVIPNNIVNISHIGLNLTATITDNISGNSCWGMVLVEDKLTPEFICPADINIECSADSSPANTGSPIVTTCEVSTTMTHSDVFVDHGQCADPRATITRTWTVTDDSGNSASCVQTINIETIDLMDVVFPADFIDANALNCSYVAEFPLATTPDSTGRPMIGAFNIDNSGLCMSSINMSDEIYDICDGSYEILRTWKVRNMCLPVGPGNPIEHVQVIKVLDTQGPVITPPADLTVNTSSTTCDVNAFIPAAAISGTCGGVDVVTITPSGTLNSNGGFVGSPLGIGTYDITFVATSTCGVSSVEVMKITVVDGNVPVAICDEHTVASLGGATPGITGDGTATIQAATFDDGSYDNCGEVWFKVRRMTPNGCNGLNGDDAPTPPFFFYPGYQEWFDDAASFCCDDIGQPVMVIFRVYDVDPGSGPVEDARHNPGGDLFGRYNDCMVEVDVQDKTAPVIICPEDKTLNCDADISVGALGDADAFDNCALVSITHSDIDLTDDCGEGVIIRTFTATDGAGNTNSCTQSITLVNEDPFLIVDTECRTFGGIQGFDPNTNQPLYGNTTLDLNGNPVGPHSRLDDVEWPCDIELLTCGLGLLPDDLENNTDANPVTSTAFSPQSVNLDARPTISEDACGNIGVGYEDLTLPIQGDACIKILRKWTIIDWCQYTVGNALGNGIWEYTQVIKVVNSEAPTVNCGNSDSFIQNFEANCGTTYVNLFIDADDDCTPQADLNYSYEISNGNGDVISTGNSANASQAFSNGTYSITWTVADGCSNEQVCTHDFEVVDAKKPTPVCISGISTVIMPSSGSVALWASDFESGSSFDNCTDYDDLVFSFSSDVTETSMEFTCAMIQNSNTLNVEIWVTDQAGNQDFCVTTVVITDTDGVCIPGPLGAVPTGTIQTDEGLDVELVTVDLVGSNMQPITTGANGQFDFGQMPISNTQYVITPEKNINWANGVTTFDLVLIRAHILGNIPFTSAYKMIAADANNSGTITTFDVVRLRQLILENITEIQENKSWRFVDAAHVFPSLNESDVFPYPETIIADSNGGDNFIGVKIGDINNSAQPNQLLGTDTRTMVGDLVFNIDDRALIAGERYKVDFLAKDFNEVLGYQFTLDFNQDAVEFVDVNGNAITGVDESNFGLVKLDQGAITTSWNKATPVTFEDDEVIFSVTFDAKEDVQLSEILSVNSRFTIEEGYNSNGELLDITLYFNSENGAVVSDAFKLYQNTPNPFKDETMIGFNLPTATRAIVKIHDVSGKVLKVIDGDFAKGYNTVTVRRDELSSTGMLYYTVETSENTATMKMIMID